MQIVSDTSNLSILKAVNPAVYQGLENTVKAGQFENAHQLYLQMCRTVKAQGQNNSVSLPAVADLVTKGFCRIPQVLDESAIREMRGLIERAFRGDNPMVRKLMEGGQKYFEGLSESEQFHHCVAVTESDLPLMKSFIVKALNMSVVSAVEAALQSHFYVNHFMISRTLPTKNPSGSFTWHRDTAPASQIHIMYYLTDSGEKGEFGSTDFLPLKATQEVEAKSAYNFRDMKSRVLDLAEICPDKDLLDQIERPVMRAGDAIIFSAPQVLHSGVAPVSLQRDAVLLVLQPSLAPWKQQLEQAGLEFMMSRVFGHFNLFSNPADP